MTQISPPEGKLGPLMAALPTEKMRAFVGAMLETGGTNYTRSAGLAGYSGDANSLRVIGHRLAHDDRIQAALLEEAKRRLATGLGVGVRVLHEIIEDDTASKKDRLRAIELLFGRTGLPAVSEQKVSVEHTVSDKQIKERIEVLARQLGLNPQELIGQDTTLPDMIDVTPEPEPVENWDAL